MEVQGRGKRGRLCKEGDASGSTGEEEASYIDPTYKWETGRGRRQSIQNYVNLEQHYQHSRRHTYLAVARAACRLRS